MQAQTSMQLQFARERRSKDLQAAAQARLIGRSASPAARQPLRRALGRRIIAIGARVAADPTIQPARTR